MKKNYEKNSLRFMTQRIAKIISIFFVILVCQFQLSLAMTTGNENDGTDYAIGLGLTANIRKVDQEQTPIIGFFVAIAGADTIRPDTYRMSLTKIRKYLEKYREELLTGVAATASTTYVLAKILSR